MPAAAAGDQLRVVLDANVVISALLSPDGRPARVLRAWLNGDFELILSPMLLAELERALAYPKLSRLIDFDEAGRVVDWLSRSATLVADPSTQPPIHSADPGDDYLLALAASERAVLVSGDAPLLALEGEAPVFSPASFLALLERGAR
jgi:putative PIN family toxin of toxin-antitoxin system